VVLTMVCYSQSEDYAVIENHNIRYAVGKAGLLKEYSNFVTGIKDYPDSILISQGFTKFLWLMGTKDDVAVQRSVTAYASDEQQFQPGILDQNGQPRADYDQYFDKIWKIELADIEHLQMLFEMDSLVMEDIPQDILTWPAISNPHFTDSLGIPIISDELAPFFDRNGDSIYDPLQGDYPIPIQAEPQCIPHNFTFHTFHDVTPRDGEEYQPLHVQINHITAMTSCDDYDALSRSIFHRLEINRMGLDSVDEIRVGIYDDADIGESVADYSGYDVGANAFYTYGNDEVDQSDAIEIPDGYAAVQSTMMLSHDYDSYAPVWAPWQQFNFDYALQGLDAEGQVAIDPATGDTTSYRYTGDPFDQEGWINRNPADKASCGVVSIPVGESAAHAVEFLELHDYITVDSQSVEVMKDHTDRLFGAKSQWHQRLALPTCEPKIAVSPCTEGCIWPGDIDKDSVVTSQDLLLQWHAAVAGESEHSGPQRSVISSRWHPVYSTDWPDSIGRCNAKYFDMEGDGTIAANDFRLFLSNYGKYHTIEQPAATEPFGDPLGLSVIIGDSLNFDPLASFFVTDMRIVHGDGEQTHPLAALCFDVGLSHSVSAIRESQLPSVFQSEIRDEVGFLELGIFCYGDKNLERLPALIQEQRLFSTTLSETDTVNLQVIIQNIAAIDTTGQVIEVGLRSAPVLKYLDGFTATSDVQTSGIQVYPNPARSHITLSSQVQLEAIRIYTIQGSLVKDFDASEQGRYNIEDVPPGAYVLEASTLGSLVVREILLVR